MQQTLSGCAFCDARSGAERGEAHTWGNDERITHSICVDCVIQTRPDPDERDRYACDGCGLVVDALAALTRFRVNSAISRDQYASARGALLAVQRPTGRAVSTNTELTKRRSIGRIRHQQGLTRRCA